MAVKVPSAITDMRVIGTIAPGTDTQAPTIPQGLTATAISKSRVDIAWTGSTDDTAVAGYQIFRNGAALTTTVATAYSDTTCLPSTTYQYSVAAFDGSGNVSQASSIASATTPANRSPVWSSVPAQSLIIGNAYSLTLGTFCSDADSDPLTFSITAGTLPTGLTLAAGIISGTPTVAGEAPTITVNATDGFANVTTTIAYHIYTADVTAPPVPTGLAATAVTTSEIDLSWNVSVDAAGSPNEFVSGTASYKLYRNGSLRTTVSGTTYQDTGLVAGTSYSYKISALDVAGNESAQSTQVVGVTAQTAVLTFPRIMLCGVGGDQSYGSNAGTGYPAWTTAPAGSAANVAIQTIGAYDIAVIAGVFEGWDSSGARDRENLTQAIAGGASYLIAKNTSRPTNVFYYEIMNVTVAGNPYAQWQSQVTTHNWFLYPQPAGGGTATSFINYSTAWPGAIGNAGVGASICGSNYGTTSSGSPTGVQGPARTFGNYASIKLLMRGYTGDSRFSFNAQMGSPSAAGIFLDECFVALDGDSTTGSASLDGVTIAPGTQQGGGFPGLDTVQPVMARGNHNMFDQMQTMLALVNPGKTYYNFANFGQYANKYQFGTATLTCGLENTLHGGLIENVIGSGASALECFERGNFSDPGTPWPSGALNILDIYYQGMDFCLAPKMVGVGVKLPSADGTITSSWPVGAGTTLTTVTAGTAFEYQLMRYSLAFTLMDNGYYAPGCTGYDWSKPRWYDEYGDDSLTQVNVKRGYLGTPLTTRPSTPQWNQGPLGVWWRAFSGGGVAWNPRGNGAQTITLPQQYQALAGTQQTAVNNGALVSSVTIPDGDGRIYILPSQAWTFSDLITGWNSLVKEDDGGTGNTCVWMSDATGSFLRYTAVKAGTCGLRRKVATTGLHEICVQYDVRRSSNSCSKQLKTYGWGQANGGATSNATFGCTMGGYAGTSYGVYYGDFATGSNDATTAYATSGYPTGSLPNIGFGDSFSRTPYPTQSTTVASSQDITGTVWETWMVYFRASSPNAADGQITIWKKVSGVWTMVMNMTNLWNCSSTTQDRGGFALYEFSSNFGFHEDYRNVYQMFAKPIGMGN